MQLQSYDERAAQVIMDSSIGVFVLLGAALGDVEFLPLKPRMADEGMLADLRDHWPGRGLRSVGVIGLVGATPKCAFKEILDAPVTHALGAAFCEYVRVLLGDNFSAHLEAAEVAELTRLYSIQDMRPD